MMTIMAASVVFHLLLNYTTHCRLLLKESESSVNSEEITKVAPQAFERGPLSRPDIVTFVFPGVTFF